MPITASGPTDTPGASVAGAVVRADDHYGAPPRGAVVGALLVVQVLFGLSYVCTKWVVDEVPPGAWAAVRACAATIVLVGTAVAWRLPFPRAGRDLAALAAVAMLGVATNQLCFVAGLALSTPGFSSVINVAIPVATLVIAWALRWERLDRRRALGVALAGGGLAILLWGTVRADWREGNWLTFANAIAFSLFLVLSRPLYRRMHPYSATAVMFVFGSVVLVAWGGGEAMAVPWGGLSTKAWIGMIYVVLGATVGTYGLNAYALRHADASLVGFFVIVQPLLATAISAIEGREALDARFVMAAVLVGTGVLTVVGLPRRAVVHTQNAERGTQNASPASVGVEP